MAKLPNEVTEFNGKSVEQIEIGKTYMLITFNDGTFIECTARGSEKFWLLIEMKT